MIKDLEKLLNLFFDYERAEITEFRKAVDQFKTDLPRVLEALRSMIERAHKQEPDFRKAAEEFLKHAQEAITRVSVKPTCARDSRPVQRKETQRPNYFRCAPSAHILDRRPLEHWSSVT